MAYHAYELKMLSLNMAKNNNKKEIMTDIFKVTNFLSSIFPFFEDTKIKKVEMRKDKNGDSIVYYYNCFGKLLNYKRSIKHLDGSSYEVMFDKEDKIVYYVDEKTNSSGIKERNQIYLNKKFA